MANLDPNWLTVARHHQAWRGVGGLWLVTSLVSPLPPTSLTSQFGPSGERPDSTALCTEEAPVHFLLLLPGDPNWIPVLLDPWITDTSRVIQSQEWDRRRCGTGGDVRDVIARHCIQTCCGSKHTRILSRITCAAGRLLLFLFFFLCSIAPFFTVASSPE